MEQPIIQIKNVTKTFQTRENRVEALKNINLEINKGDIYGIIGMSGAGKSTLVRCLNFLEKPTGGTVLIEGQDLSACTCLLYTSPVVPWNAGQGGPEEADFPASLRGFSLYRKTGLIWHRKYTINQLLSLKTSRPELFERMDCFLSVSDYLFFRLTGERRTEESLACRTMLYNIFEGQWDSELTAFAGVTGKMPPVGKGSTGWPILKKELASRYGLPDKISVRIGGHDHLCAARCV